MKNSKEKDLHSLGKRQKKRQRILPKKYLMINYLLQVIKVINITENVYHGLWWQITYVKMEESMKNIWDATKIHQML